MAHIGKSSKTNFQLVLSKIPTADTITESKSLSLNIFNTVIPSITIQEIEMSFMGGKVFMEGGGIDYGEWNVTFHVDNELSNYSLKQFKV